MSLVLSDSHLLHNMKYCTNQIIFLTLCNIQFDKLAINFFFTSIHLALHILNNLTASSFNVVCLFFILSYEKKVVCLLTEQLYEHPTDLVLHFHKAVQRYIKISRFFHITTHYTHNSSL